MGWCEIRDGAMLSTVSVVTTGNRWKPARIQTEPVAHFWDISESIGKKSDHHIRIHYFIITRKGHF